MKQYRLLILILGLTLNSAAHSQGAQPANDQPLVNEHLKPFLPFVGKTWRGEFANSTPETPVVDVSRWELVLNGQWVDGHEIFYKEDATARVVFK